MADLRISADLALPLDAVTQTFGILAVRGAGKSNLAAVMAEGMFAAGLPFCVIDPVGSWWGLRSSGDGNGAGLPIPIFGGRHGDVPLERTGGALIADLVVDRRLTCVLDVSELSEGDKVRFLIDFAERLYRRNTEPLHLFLEEADDYCPERFTGEKARLLGAWQNIVRRGRARGLGITMITQRSAAISKSVLTQIETLFAMRTTSPQDRAAVKAWVDYQGGAQSMLETLPTLESGEAWVWSPSWLKAFKRVRVRRRETFDSGATPKTLKGTRPPATLANVDLAAVRVAMADTIAKAKQDDPRELRAELAAARKEIEALKRAPAPKPVTETKVKEVRALTAEDRKRIERLVDQCDELVEKADRAGAGLIDAQQQHMTRLQGLVDSLRERGAEARKMAADLRAALAPPVPLPSSVAMRPAPTNGARPTTVTRATRPTNGAPASDLPKGELAVLTAAAQCGDEGATREQLSILTGYKRSTRDAYVQRARERGYLAESRDGNVVATPEGVAALGSGFEPLPTGDALRTHWLARLPQGEAQVLEVVCARYPEAVGRDTVTELTGYKRSTRDAYLQRLGTRKLIEVGRDGVMARGELFG